MRSPNRRGLSWMMSGLLAVAASQAAARPMPPSSPGPGGPPREQDVDARVALARIPGREALLAAIVAADGLTTQVGMLTMAGGRRFYLKHSPGMRAARLMMRDAAGGETVLMEPHTFSEPRQSAEIEQFAPSRNASLVGVAISTDGSQGRVLRVVATASGAALPDAIRGAGLAILCWAPDGRSFFYTRRSPASAHSRLLRHWLGTDPARDPVVLDPDQLPFPSRGERAILGLSVIPGSDMVLAELGTAARPELSLYTASWAQLGAPRLAWRLLCQPFDQVVGIAIRGVRIDLLTRDHAPHGRIVETDLAASSIKTAIQLVPEGSGVLTGLAAARDALYFTRRDGSVTTLLRLADHAQRPEVVTFTSSGTIAPPRPDSAGLTADPTRAGVDFSVESWVHPTAWLHYDPDRHTTQDLGIVPAFARPLGAYRVVETTAPAREGVRIPLAIISRSDTARGHAPPVLLVGIAADGRGAGPEFTPSMLPWLDAGGLLAVAHVRGGIDSSSDLIDSARTLIAHRITDSAHLAGGDAGPLSVPIGDAITGRADLFRAALIRAGAGAEARSGTEFAGGGAARIPAVLLTGGAEAPSARLRRLADMADRLRRSEDSIAPGLRRPVLLRIEAGDAEAADQQAFLLWQMGEPGFQPAAE